jgi:hypothetical protein
LITVLGVASSSGLMPGAMDNGDEFSFSLCEHIRGQQLNFKFKNPYWWN